MCIWYLPMSKKSTEFFSDPQLKRFSGNKQHKLIQNGPKRCIFRNFQTHYLGSTKYVPMAGRYRWILYRCCTFGFFVSRGGVFLKFRFYYILLLNVLSLAGSWYHKWNFLFGNLKIYSSYFAEQFTLNFRCCSAAPPNNKQNSRCCTAAYAAPDGYRPVRHSLFFKNYII